MNSSSLPISVYLQPGKRVHLIGIGGVSMRPLGLVLQGRGLRVTGSDMNSSVSTQDLINAGIPVFIGHRAENIYGAECIIRTAAAHNDNPEIQAARALGIPVFERAQAWGYIMRGYANAVCISGTHGKTTTTSMITEIGMAAGIDPTVMIGGYLPSLHSGHRVGSGNTIIAESCEYCNSFLNFYPTIAVINNIEADHLDFFSGIEDIRQSFRKFALLVPENGCVIGNGDDANVSLALNGIPYISFGLSEQCCYRAVNLSDDYSEYELIKYGAPWGHIRLNVFGLHNVYNSLAAVAAAEALGIDQESILGGLEHFCGAGRRMEKKGEYNGAVVYDDYAHHPGELHALLSTVSKMGFKRIICAFQPHTYTRTKALFDEFITELKLADVALVAEIYAARESNTIGISSMDLVRKIPGSVYCPSLPAVTAEIRKIAQPGDVILTVGAGDIYKAGEALF